MQAATSPALTAREAEADRDAAIRALAAQTGNIAGVRAVEPGYVIEGGRITDRACIVVAADPDRIAAVRAAAPAAFAGFPVEVRPAGILQQLGLDADLSAQALAPIRYNDDDRSGEGFSFAEIDEDMSVICHVGPERSWEVLSEFLSGTQSELVSSMYEFHAEHIADAIGAELDDGTSLKLVLGPESRNPPGDIPAGDFDRSETFATWEQSFGDKFDRIFVPEGGGGLVASAYHIKVTVRDRDSFWLSSGNWKRSSQPLIAAADRNNPAKAKGNREWHVVIENGTLARRFRNHILADFEQSEKLGGGAEAVAAEILIDVPIAALQAIELAPLELLEPLPIRRRVRVKPLLTPDRQGNVYTDAVIDLIGSARRQLVLQNQYIKIKPSTGGNLALLVDALIEKSNEIDDVRIILRSGDDFDANVQELKRRGMRKVNERVRRMSNTHTKGIVVDGERVLIGSQNWSADAVSANRDASLIFDDGEIAQYFLRAFEVDWQRASRLGETGLVAVDETPRPAVGDRPPPGFVRMRLADYLEG